MATQFLNRLTAFARRLFGIDEEREACDNNTENSKICDNCIRYNRFATQQGWKMNNFALSVSDNVAVSGYNCNTCCTFIDLHRRSFDSTDNFELFNTIEFEQTPAYQPRLVSFLNLEPQKLVTCSGSKLEVINIKDGKVLSSRRVIELTVCLSVSENKIYVGFKNLKEVVIFNRHLNEIRTITLQGIKKDDWPIDMAVAPNGLYICTFKNRGILLKENDGNLLTEYTNSTKEVFYAHSITVSEHLNLVAVLRGNNEISLYPHSDDKSILTVKVGPNVCRIKFSDNGKLATGDRETGTVTFHEVGPLFNYHQVKEYLISLLEDQDYLKLVDFFSLPKDLLKNGIISPRTIFLALEEKGVICYSSLDKLTEAFNSLDINISCLAVTDNFQERKIQPTDYDRFLATLSSHLASSLVRKLCAFFDFSVEMTDIITNRTNPGLFLLMDLNNRSIISSFDVKALERPFTSLQLTQAVAMIHEYQSLHEDKICNTLSMRAILSLEAKEEIFCNCLQWRIKTWYKTMSPIPGKMSCEWKSSDLFVSSSLVLSNTKTKRTITDIDENCKLEYKDIFVHDRLVSESRIVIEGDPGCGKTMMSSQMAYDWATGKTPTIRFLIFLPLKLVGDRPLVKVISDFYRLQDKGLTLTDIEFILKRGAFRCCFLLDGLEEYNSWYEREVGETSEVMKVLFKAKYPACKVVITCRSGYAEDLPLCPMLKLGQFSRRERMYYIEKAFPYDYETRLYRKNAVEEIPYLLDVCIVPVLFVLVVHNIECIQRLQEHQFHSVTPCIVNIVQGLCPSLSLPTTTYQSGDYKQKKLTLSEIAYNGLCTGIQQLSWNKHFFEMNVAYNKQWIESGIIVVDESHVSLICCTDGHKAHRKYEIEKDPGLKRKRRYIMNCNQTTKTSDCDTRSSNINTLQESLRLGQANADKKYKQTQSSAEYVNLKVKFLHKIVQELFAANHFSLKILSLKTLSNQERFLRETMPFINPADLHFVLRFTCAFYPPSCPLIMTYLLQNYHTIDNKTPEHVMNCVFLCIAECNVEKIPSLVQAVKEVCKQDITIHSTDSKFLQEAKVKLLKLASEKMVNIKKLSLRDLVVAASEDTLRFNSGISMQVLNTVDAIEISRWDQLLDQYEYQNMLQFIGRCHVKKAELMFPDQAPDVDKWTSHMLENIQVEWLIGPWVRQLFNTETSQWLLHVGQPISDEECQKLSQACSDYNSKDQFDTSTSADDEFSESSHGSFCQDNLSKTLDNIHAENDFEHGAEVSSVLDYSDQSGITLTGRQEKSDDLPLGEIFQMLSQEISLEWTFVGRNLGLKDTELDHIRYDYCRHSLREIIYRMLCCWKQKFGPQATIRELAKALRKAKRCDLAELVDTMEKCP